MEYGICIWDKCIRVPTKKDSEMVNTFLYECIHKLLQDRLFVRELIHSSSSQCLWASPRESKLMLSATYL